MDTGTKRGRRTIDESEKRINLGICGTQADLEYLLTWNESSKANAFAELIEDIRKIRPGGRYSAPRPTPGCRSAPGTKTTLKKRIRALEAQLKAAGIEPAEESV